MKLRDKINKDYMTAFKEKNTSVKNLLSVIKGEIQTIEKNKGVELSDDDVVKILTKTSKSLKEMANSGSEDAKNELDIIEAYLPKQMSESEITNKVKELIGQGFNNIGSIMKDFSNFPCDKKLVSKIVKENLCGLEQ